MTYTREQVEKMSDGELNAAVAERVMGWTLETQRGDIHGARDADRRFHMWSPDDMKEFNNWWSPATDGNAMREVTESKPNGGGSLHWVHQQYRDGVYGPWWVRCLYFPIGASVPDIEIWTRSDTLPRAVAEAALLAVTANQEATP